MNDRIIKIYISESNGVGVMDHNGKNRCLLRIESDDLMPIIEETIKNAKFGNDGADLGIGK